MYLEILSSTLFMLEELTLCFVLIRDMRQEKRELWTRSHHVIFIKISRVGI